MSLLPSVIVTLIFFIWPWDLPVCANEWPFQDLYFTEYCQATEYVNGKWMHEDNDDVAIKPINKSFVCCGWDTMDYRDPEIAQYCYQDSYNHEFYTGNDDVNGSNILLMGGHACICDEMKRTRLIRSNREKWRWKPNNCILRPWNGTEFCRVLGDRKVLFIGDSTMQQTAATLMAMLQSYQPRALCSSKIYFARTDELTVAEVVPFTKVYQPNFTILSAGAHYSDPFQYYETMREMLQSVREYQHSNYDAVEKTNSAQKIEYSEHFIDSISVPFKGNKFIWKTMNPGHTQCDDYFNATTFYPPLRDDKYLWTHFKTFDKTMLKLAKEFDLDVIDMRPLYFRPDAHPGRDAWAWAKKGGDCLHFCLPGPLDLFSELLLNYLLNEEELMKLGAIGKSKHMHPRRLSNKVKRPTSIFD